MIQGTATPRDGNDPERRALVDFLRPDLDPPRMMTTIAADERRFLFSGTIAEIESHT